MFTQCKWILIYNTLIIVLLHSNAVKSVKNRNNITKFAGIVKNITVFAVKNENYSENDNMFKSMKLNISWMPPNGERQPSSYSIMVTSISKKNDTNRIECIERSALYTIQNKSQYSLLIPNNKLLNDMPEMQIRPNCTYKIQVYANPRAKPVVLGSVGKLPEVIYTVPECLQLKCSCVYAKTILSVPKVHVIQTEKNIIINWNITLNTYYIHSYVISVGIPLLTSKAGNLVYNITNIGTVASTINTFTWDYKLNNQYIKIKKGYKVLVAATDYQGCLGIEGNLTILSVDNIETLQGNVIWFLLAGIITCFVLGLLSFVLLCGKNQPVWSPAFLCHIRPLVSRHSSCISQWPDLATQKHNILYVEQKIEEICFETHKNDEYEIPYKYINITCELGKGQFGKVYLGSLNDNKGTLVAVKMSQCSDVNNKLEARQQMLEEIRTMKIVGSHPHLVSLIGYCTLPDKPICILLEYMEGGDLLAYLHSKRNVESNKNFVYNSEKIISRYINIIEKDKNKKISKDLYGIISKQQFIKFALDIAKGMEHLETKQITHRDLAARNILLTSNLTLKISDFGLSRNGVYVINNLVGKVRQLPIRWMSPEAVRDHVFSSKSDVWSFAIVLWEIGTLGSFPYSNIQDDMLLQFLIRDNYRLKCPDTISHDIYKIMCSCWSTISQNRPSFVQLVVDLQKLKEPLHSINDTSNPCYTLLLHQ